MGALNLLTLINGVMLFCEEFRKDQLGWYSDAKKTVMAVPSSAGGNELSFIAVHKSAFRPTNVFIPHSGVLMAQDVGDEAMLAQFRAAVQGLVMAPKGMKIVK
jgi:hypothetical protein